MNPKTKIFYNGKQIRTAAGQFDSFKAKVRRFFNTVLFYTKISAVALGIFFLGAFTFSTNRSEAYTVDNTPLKIAQLKADVISKLAACESAGHSEDEGLIVFDSNKIASLGNLQFQTKTVQYYYKKLYGQDITPKEATLIALDYSKASKLASDVIFRDGGNPEKDWYNCSRKLGLKAEVDVINKLSN